MDIEELAKSMRDRALMLELNPDLTERDFHAKRMQVTRKNQLSRLEKIKKLYFNAGRWAGGARDHVAREAFYKINEAEK